MNVDERVTTDPEFDAFVEAGTRGANAEAFRDGLETRRQIVALGAQLRAARERAGLKQAELASRAGLTQSVVSRLELGTMDRGGPALRTLLRYARGCGLELGFELRSADVTVVAGEIETVEQALDSIESLGAVKGALPSLRLEAAAPKLARVKRRLPRDEPSGSSG